MIRCDQTHLLKRGAVNIRIFPLKSGGNEGLANRDWVAKRHMEWIMDCGGQYAAVADLMRWEILLEEGGVALDSDSICLERLPDWLFYCDLFASWEDEYARPGIIANGYVGCRPDNNTINEIVSRLSAMQNWPRRFSWSKFRWEIEPAWKVTFLLGLLTHRICFSQVKGVRERLVVITLLGLTVLLNLTDTVRLLSSPSPDWVIFWMPVFFVLCTAGAIQKLFSKEQDPSKKLLG